MLVFVLYIVVCLMSWYSKSKDEICRKTRMLRVSCILLFVIMGFRDYSVGNDTYRYYLKYMQYQLLSWKSIGLLDLNYGFNYFTKIMGTFFPSGYTLYLLVISAFCSFAVYKYLNAMSEDALVSQIMLLSLGFVFFFITGLKQSIAISFILLAYIKLKDKKYFGFLMMSAFATLFHTTAIVVILALPISLMKLKKSYLVVAPLLIGLAYTFRSQVFNFMRTIAADSSDRYLAYGSTYTSSVNITGFLIQAVVFSFSLFLLQGHFEEDNELSSEFGIYVLGMMFQAMTGIMAEFFRLSMYFSVFGVILLPKALNRGFSKNTISIAKFLVLSVFVLYFIFFSSQNSYIIPYKFVSFF